MKTLKKPRFLQCFVRVELLKINKKSAKNRYNIDANFELEQKTFRNHTKIGFGRVLGSIWEWFGRVLGLFWELLGASGAFFECLKSSFYKALVQDGLQEAF